MSRWRDDPERAAGDLLAGVAGRIQLTDNFARRFLAIDGPPLGDVLSRGGVLGPQDTVAQWSRRSSEMAPPNGPFDAAFLRLPKDKDDLVASAHLAMARLGSDGALVIYGGNDEGIRSVAGRFADLDTRFETVAARGHGRVLRGRRPADISRLKAMPADWRRLGDIDLGHGRRPWVSYAGSFVDGGLDAGTRLLVSVLPALRVRAELSVLDFACGTGVIAHALVDALPACAVDLVEIDAWSRAAARENVPEARAAFVELADVPPDARYDLIVSNPPFHAGFREDLTVLQALIARAPEHLVSSGQLLVVTQKRFALDALLAGRFAAVEIAADDGRYRVWSARV